MWRGSGGRSADQTAKLISPLKVPDKCFFCSWCGVAVVAGQRISLLGSVPSQGNYGPTNFTLPASFLGKVNKSYVITIEYIVFTKIFSRAVRGGRLREIRNYVDFTLLLIWPWSVLSFIY